jgi:hypothetical protein
VQKDFELSGGPGMKEDFKQLSFGNHRILERVAAGEPIPHHEGSLWTIFEEGYATVEDGFLKITDRGKRYLKKLQCPDFPKAKRRNVSTGTALKIAGIQNEMMNALEAHIATVFGVDMVSAERFKNAVAKTIFSELEDFTGTDREFDVNPNDPEAVIV